MRLRPRLTTLLVLALLLSSAPASGKTKTAGTVRLIFVGDIMLADDEETGILVDRHVDPFQPFAKALQEADVAIGNLECVVATTGDPVKKRYQFRAQPRCLPRLKQYFTAFSVANNHSGDFGKTAFVEQCELLENNDIPYFGGGRNKVDAHKPWIVERNGVRIALLGYCEVFSKSFQAEEHLPGVAWSENDAEVLADIRSARQKHRADVVIPFMHWGIENEPPSQRQRSFARKMIDSGADAIVGAHPHVTQGVEYYKNRPIVYSLGNFLFNGFTHPDNLTGWALRLTVNRKGMVAWDTIVVRLDKRGIPHPDLKTKSPSGHADSSQIVLKCHDG